MNNNLQESITEIETIAYRGRALAMSLASNSTGQELHKNQTVACIAALGEMFGEIEGVTQGAHELTDQNNDRPTEKAPAPAPATKTEASEVSFDSVRQHLRNAEMIVDLVFDSHGDSDGHIFKPGEYDPFQCFGLAAGHINAAFNDAEQLDGPDIGPFSMYTLKMLYVREHLSLLVTKMGAKDFDRVAAVGLAQILVGDLVEELDRHSK